MLHSNYEFVILDIGGAVDGTFQVLDMCRRIYMPVLSDPVSISKIAQFENLVRIWDYPQILTRTVKVRLFMEETWHRRIILKGCCGVNLEIMSGKF